MGDFGGREEGRLGVRKGIETRGSFWSGMARLRREKNGGSMGDTGNVGIGIRVLMSGLGASSGVVG